MVTGISQSPVSPCSREGAPLRDCSPKLFALPASLFQPLFTSLWASMGCPVAATGELPEHVECCHHAKHISQNKTPATSTKISSGLIKTHTLLKCGMSPSRTATWCHGDTPAPTFAACRFCHIHENKTLPAGAGIRYLTGSLTLQVLTGLDWEEKTTPTASNSK